jgi:hypothetical protein
MITSNIAKRMVRYLVLSASFLLIGISVVRANVSIGHVENTPAPGEFQSSAGGTLSTGGISFGYFSGTAPTPSQWSTLATEPALTAYANLTNTSGTFKFVDIRNIGSASFSGSWDFAGGSPLINGTTSAIDNTILVPNTQLFMLAFNSGTFATGFSGANSWAAITSATSWLSPANNTTLGYTLAQVSSGGTVMVGTQSGNNVLLAAPAPEPSAWLSIIGGAGLLLHIRRNRGYGKSLKA